MQIQGIHLNIATLRQFMQIQGIHLNSATLRQYMQYNVHI